MSRAITVLVFGVCFCITLDGQSPAPSFCRPEGRSAFLAQVPEASGIAASRRTPGLWWTLNDSGNPVIVGVDASARIRQRVALPGARVDDWEDIAAGKCAGGNCLYIADIGDNHAGRSRITIYRIPEPGPSDTSSATPEVFHASYPDRAHDAEALLVTPQEQLFILTKEAPARLYRFPTPLKPGATARLEFVRALKEKDRITGASVSFDGAWVAARSHDALLLYRMGDFVSGNGDPFRIDLTSLKEPQGEGVSFGAGDQLMLVSEGGGGGMMTRLKCTLPTR